VNKAVGTELMPGSQEVREKERAYDAVHARMLTAETELESLKALSENQAAALVSATESEKVLQVRPLNKILMLLR
jgi:hypothetical protein